MNKSPARDVQYKSNNREDEREKTEVQINLPTHAGTHGLQAHKHAWTFRLPHRVQLEWWRKAMTELRQRLRNGADTWAKKHFPARYFSDSRWSHCSCRQILGNARNITDTARHKGSRHAKSMKAISRQGGAQAVTVF